MTTSADSEDARSQVWEIARGGPLYDTRGKLLGRELQAETHPAYPASGKQKGADGAYGKGSHYAGIKGPRAMVGTGPKAIVKVITDANHRYTEAMIGGGEMKKLVLFASIGRIDMEQHIDRARRKSRGEAGWAIFGTRLDREHINCARRE